MAVTVEELENSPTYTFDRKGGSGKRIVKLDWSDVGAFLLEIMPSSYLSGVDIVVPPAATFPGLPWLYAMSADVEPMFPESPVGDGVFPAVYTHAKITINYQTEDFNQKNSEQKNDGPGGNQGSTGGSQETFISHKVGIGGEFMSWPAQSLRFDQGSDPTDGETEGRGRKVSEDAMIGVIVPLIDHEITWHFVPFPPWTPLRLSVGCVNAYSFAGAPPETMLFLGSDAEREITNEGARAWSMDYKYNEKNQNPFDAANPQGWNHFLRPDGYSAGTFQRINRRAPGGYSPLATNIVAGTTDIQVESRATFPQSLGATVPLTMEVDNEWMTWFNTPGGSEPTVFKGVTRGANGTIAAAHSKGAIVRQVLFATSINAMTILSTAVVVNDISVFPAVGQFFVTIMTSPAVADLATRELALVWRVDRNTNTLFLLRGVRGAVPVAHVASSIVQMMYSPVYPLADFRLLYLSGLITG